MTKPKYTPGPWEVINEFNVYGKGHRLVAACGGRSQNYDVENNHIEKVASAHLIAAAPDMYEALKQICNDCDPAEKYCPDSFEEEKRICIDCYIGKALAKAEGNNV